MGGSKMENTKYNQRREKEIGAIFMPCKVCLPRQSNEHPFALQGVLF